MENYNEVFQLLDVERIIAIFNKLKCHFYFFYKIREQEGITGPAWWIGTSGKGEAVGKGQGK
jgi:hypothetical protein